MQDALLVVFIVVSVGLGVLAAVLWAQAARGTAETAAARDGVARAEQELGRERQVRAEAERSGASLTAELRAKAEAAGVELAESTSTHLAMKERFEAMTREHDAEMAKGDEIHRKELEAIRAAKAEIERTSAELLKQSKETFDALAGNVARQTTEDLLRRGEAAAAAERQKSAAERELSGQRIEQMVKPLHEALVQTQAKLAGTEKQNAEALGRLAAELKAATDASVALRAETGKLSQALRRPEVRGRYGEIQLERVAELAGMRSYCDFSTQESRLDSDGNRKRPDMIVKLPNDRQIAVDAKTNISAYLEAIEAGSPEAAEERLCKFADDVKAQALALSKKEYWVQYEGSPDFVVMFVPGDQFIDAALARRPELLDFAAQHNVILASPSTLIGLLRAVNVGWRQKQVEDRAQELMGLGKELHERAAKVWEGLEKMGKGIAGLAKDYNEVTGSIETRLTPTLRKFEEAGARSAKEVVALPEVVVTGRAAKLLPGVEKAG